MHIPKPKSNGSTQDNLRDDLEKLIAQPGSGDSPPCPYCKKYQPNSCSSACSEAPRALSIEPELYPIERAAVPVVYEMNVLRLVQTCWSCEGHMGADGQLWKLPQVSFYSASPIYVQLLANRVAALRQAKRLGYDWQIAFSSYGHDPAPTYTLEPRFRPGDEVRLGTLQQDLKIIGDNLNDEIRLAAQELLKQLD